jgi:PPOX class probable F420-dependent enzyme
VNLARKVDGDGIRGKVMASRRDQVKMTDTEVAAYLDEQRVLNVATNGPTGHPHIVAMWYAMVDGRPAFWTFGKSQKVVNLRRDPRITGLVESGDSYGELRGVELVGSAQLVEDFDAIVDIGRAVAVKYQGEAADRPEARAFLETQARKRIGVTIDVERTVSWDHTKLGGTY